MTPRLRLRPSSSVSKSYSKQKNLGSQTEENANFRSLPNHEQKFNKLKLKSLDVPTAKRTQRNKNLVLLEEANEESTLKSLAPNHHTIHTFSDKETSNFRSELLKFYDTHRRDLPWRKFAEHDNTAFRAYAVLVSEVMLQQTQVVTVKAYYDKWMSRWPSFEDLSKATLEEVNEMWAGLGYYGRAKRLFEASKKIVNELDGAVPTTAAKLQEVLPGVGKYTGGAVASIAFKERVAAVDGNVIRVLARMRFIGGNCNSQAVLKEIWNVAQKVIDVERPGDFNQAVMELGAVICTPRSPKCEECPVKNVCLAYKFNRHSQLSENGNETRAINDIETLPDCFLCMPESEPWDSKAGVMNFPRKAKKAAPRPQETAVALIYRKCNEEEYLIMKRPSSGLLANLWEFPSCDVENETRDAWPFLKQELNKNLDINDKDIKSQEFVCKVKHIFSHINQIYVVYTVQISHNIIATTPDYYQNQQWVTKSQLLSSAISTGVKKIFNSYHAQQSGKTSHTKRKHCKISATLQPSNDKKSKQSTLINYFIKPVN